MSDSPFPSLDSDDGKPATRGDQLYAAIVERIIDGEFEPGSRLPSETALAKQFNVSRPVVREALARLRDHGLVHSRRGSGSYVDHGPRRELLRFAPVANIADLQRCLEFRIAVESRAARLAAERHDARTLAGVETAMEELETAIRTGALGVDADYLFHRSVAEAARNAYFEEALEMLTQQVRVGMTVMRNLSLLKPSERLRLVQNEHLAVLEAIRRRDADGASEAMATHIDNARRRMLEG